MSNKIKYGLRNVHYAVITESGGTITYGTPKRLPGAVNLSLSPVGEKTEFYADDILYFGGSANQGYDGTLEIAIITDEFRIEVLNDVEDKNGALFENADAIANNIALLFQFAGDASANRHALYHCTVARPDITGQTKEAQIDPQTETLNITATPHPKTMYVKAKVGQGQIGYDTFFDSVYEFVEDEG